MVVNQQGSPQEIDGSYFMYGSSNQLANGEADGKEK